MSYKVARVSFALLFAALFTAPAFPQQDNSSTQQDNQKPLTAAEKKKQEDAEKKAKKEQEKIGYAKKGWKISCRDLLVRKQVCAGKRQSGENGKKAAGVGRGQKQAQQQCRPRNTPAKVDLPAAFLFRGHAQVKVIRRVIHQHSSCYGNR